MARLSPTLIAEMRATILLAAPLVLTNVAQSLMHATDVALVGRLGRDALAAAGLGFNLYVVFQIFGTGLVVAAAPMMAQERGRFAHSVRDIRRTVRAALWTAAILVLPCWALLWNAAVLLRLLGQDAGLAAAAQTLVRPLMFGLLPWFVYLALRSYVSAMERPGWALLIGLLGVPANLAINLVLIFGAGPIPPLGLMGAGIGSATVNLLMALGLAAIVLRHRRFRRYHLFGRFWRGDAARLRRIWALGLPIAATMTLEVGVFAVSVMLMGLVGADALAAHNIAIQIAALSFMVPLGLSQAVTVRVGLALGRGDADGVTRAGWTAFAMGTGFMAFMALPMLFVPRTLLSFFVELDDPSFAAAIPLAVAFLGVAAVFQVVDGAQSVGEGMLRGLSDTRVPALIALVGYWGIGLSTGAGLAFGLGWGGIGIWIGLATGLAVVACGMVLRWTRRERLGLVARRGVGIPAAAL